MIVRRLKLRAIAEDESGQALIYVALVMAVLVTVLFAVFDLGKLTTAKIKAQNGADAAALAAVSVKVSVHHTRELAYLAMTEESLRARIAMMRALANLTNDAEYAKQTRLAEGHIRKLDKLHAGLQAYNQWIDQEGPEIVADAARLGYAANIQGMNNHLASGLALDAANVREIDAPGALRENSNQSRFIGAVDYPKEGLGKGKGAGKSFVEVDPKFMGLNWSLFGGGVIKPLDVPAWAAAGYVKSSDLQNEGAGDVALKQGGVGLEWYSPRLVRTGRRQDGSFGGPNSGGGIESQH